MKILIVDDDTNKQNKIANEIMSIKHNNDLIIESESFITKALNYFKDNKIDLLILDICLPERIGEHCLEDGGIKLLNWLKESKKYSYPNYVISISQYEKLTEKFELDDGMIHKSILYDDSSTKWREQLKNYTQHIYDILKNEKKVREYNYDVAVICALPEELDLVKKILEDVSINMVDGDEHIYYKGTYKKDDKNIKVVLTNSTSMGMVPAATLTTKLIHNFTPKYLIMTGIAAGIEEKVNYGDVIAAQYSWNYGSGKNVNVNGTSKHKNTIEQIAINTQMEKYVRLLMNDIEFFSKIKKDFLGNKPNCELKLVLGPVASGASVIADENIVADIRNNQIRDVLGIEMEIFGVYYASKNAINPKPNFLAIKSVCDFANQNKNDDYHIYASYTSAKVLEKLISDYFDYSK